MRNAAASAPPRRPGGIRTSLETWPGGSWKAAVPGRGPTSGRDLDLGRAASPAAPPPRMALATALRPGSRGPLPQRPRHVAKLQWGRGTLGFCSYCWKARSRRFALRSCIVPLSEGRRETLAERDHFADSWREEFGALLRSRDCYLGSAVQYSQTKLSISSLKCVLLILSAWWAGEKGGRVIWQWGLRSVF